MEEKHYMEHHMIHMEKHHMDIHTGMEEDMDKSKVEEKERRW
jgi:hypothetical protein